MKIGILGGGSWGTGIGAQLARKNNVFLWEFDKSQVCKIQKERENKKFLPGISLPPSMSFSYDMKSVIDQSDVVLFAVPSSVLPDVALQTAKAGISGKTMVSLVKGIEPGTFRRMSQVISDAVGTKEFVCALSGPSHAEEVARNIPTAVILAHEDTEHLKPLQKAFSTDTFRVYLNTDIIGVEIGGAAKNCIAIAAGIIDGLGFGVNTKAALLTRGMAEIHRLCINRGGKKQTLSGLSGMGDLITTCFSQHSRNRHVGEELGKGRFLDDILKKMIMVAEGVETTRSLHELARRGGVNLPITDAVYRVLFKNSSPASEVIGLMTRPQREEFS